MRTRAPAPRSREHVVCERVCVLAFCVCCMCFVRVRVFMLCVCARAVYYDVCTRSARIHAVTSALLLRPGCLRFVCVNAFADTYTHTHTKTPICVCMFLFRSVCVCVYVFCAHHSRRALWIVGVSALLFRLQIYSASERRTAWH